MRNGSSKRKVPKEDGQKVERYDEKRDAQMQDEGNKGQDHAMYQRGFHEWRRVTSGASIEAAQKVLTSFSGDGSASEGEELGKEYGRRAIDDARSSGGRQGRRGGEEEGIGERKGAMPEGSCAVQEVLTPHR